MIERPIVQTLFWVLVSCGSLFAQVAPYDADWYDPGAEHVKVLVSEDGIQRVEAADLANLGVPIGSIDPSTLRLIENGSEIPLWYEGSGATVNPLDHFLFVGRRNSGVDEDWVYGYGETEPSSTYRSLYTDTTTYFLTWGGASGLRYQRSANNAVAGPVVDKVAVEQRLETDDRYFFGEPSRSGDPRYTAGEGYYMALLSHGATILRQSLLLPLSDLTRGSEDSLGLSVKLLGGTRSPHLAFVDLRYQEPGTEAVEMAFDSVSWRNYELAELSATLAQEWVPGAGTTLRIRVGSDNTVGATPNNIYIDYVAYRYTRLLSPESGQFSFDFPFSGAATFKLSGSSETQVIVLEPESRTRYDVAGDGTFGSISEPGRVFWLSGSQDAKRPPVVGDATSNLAAVSNRADYLIISAPDLLQSANDLAAYRQSAAGGQYQTMVVNVNDVFDQFDYGRATPIAIRRFIQRTRQWTTRPSFVAIVGDALYPDARRPRFGWEVPSFGNASSDGWFAMQSGEDLDNYIESVAIGRVTARTNQTGSAFVTKVAAYESRPAGSWQKRAILMSGGATTGEQATLRSHTRRWGGIMSSAPFGGDVTYFHKTTTAALDPTFLDSVDTAINEGSGWLGFFGHSAADTWEIVTENPTLFDNSQTLPVAVSLGCLTGAFARGDGSQFDQPPFAELLVTESPNGAIAHYGGSTSSFISAARQVADPFYDVVFVDGLRILGEIVVESKRRYLRDYPFQNSIETVLQYNLIGDPATQVALPTQPDLQVLEESIAIAPEAPVAGIDSSLTVTVSIENRGTVPADSSSIEVTQISPGRSPVVRRARVPAFPLEYETALQFPVANVDVGQNTFHLRVDVDNEVAEFAEDNNEASVERTIFASGVIQLFPQDHGLLTSTSPKLLVGKASTAVPRLAIRAEVDTSLSFNSEALVDDAFETGALSSWMPPSPLLDEGDYFWRVSVDNEDPEWRTRRFSVRQDLPFDGWYQNDRQFRENDPDALVTFEEGKWRLRNYSVDIRIRSAQFLGSAANTIIVGGFEHQTLAVGFAAVIVKPDGLYKTSDSFVAYPNQFNRDEAVERDRLRSFLASALPNEYVFINSRLIRIAPGATELPEETKAIFRDFGSTQIDSVDLQDLWNFGIRVGDETPLVDEWQDRDPNLGPHILWSDLSIPVRFASGIRQSPTIGPAINWREVRFDGIVSNERSSIEMLVLSLEGDTLGRATLDSPGGTGRIDLSGSGANVDARLHPFIRLAAVFTDSTRLDTPQLSNWYVGFDPVSEIAIEAPELSASVDTLGEGDAFETGANVLNGGPSLIDSVFVSYLVTDRSNRTTLETVDTLLGIAPGQTASSNASLSTAGRVGRNRVTIRAQQLRGPEPVTFNNTTLGAFYIRGDETPPVFSLTVDGASYPNDPRVINTTDDPTLPFFSSRPLIEVTVTDENDFLPLTDTTTVQMTLDGRRISYTRPDVTFEPADPDGENKARVAFTPDFTGEDTTHTLTVWAQDASGNSEPTKEEPYTLSFRIQTAAEIENLYPYPNPMHNFTTFMFNLRGADPGLVEDLRIRVYTISGRPVREFDLLDDPALLEDGGLRIGWNRLVWDGRDADGDLLATGVYLYKVFLRAEGREISVNNDSSVEKIAIIR